MENSPQYKRVLLKISGEALMGDQVYGLEAGIIDRIAKDIREVRDLGVGVAVVVGGGNIFRGLSGAASGMDRTTADHMGMLATVINALALQSALEHNGLETRVQTAIPMTSVAEPYIRRRAIRHIEKGRVVIFGAGTGNPYFTTDTPAVLRALEMECDVLLKGTKVDGVYDADPAQVGNARRYERLSFHRVLTEDLGVMDHAAISLARENKMPILVFSIYEPGAFAQVVCGKGRYTMINDED